MAGEIRRSGFGFHEQSRTDRAVAHLIDAVKRQNCNCLEITQIRRRSFLGLPYTSLALTPDIFRGVEAFMIYPPCQQEFRFVRVTR
jgi:hypothetical protein